MTSRWLWFVGLLVILSVILLNTSPPAKKRPVRKLVLEENRERFREVLDRLDRLSESLEWADMLVVADTYRVGHYPDYTPNTDLAKALYLGIIAKAPDASVQADARASLHTCTFSPLDATDIAGSPLPVEPGLRVLRRLQAMLRVPPPIVPRRAKPPPVPERFPVHSDPQNSHDHSVTGSYKRTLDTLPKGTGNALEDIEAVLASGVCDMTDDDLAKAYAVLDSLGCDSHSKFGVSERDALESVWARIQTLGELRSNAVETLCKQLASAYERGAIVCSTGKMTRILGALDGITEAPAKPLWAIKEELGDLAAKIRTDVLDEAGPARAVLYERGECLELESTMRERLMDKARHAYPDIAPGVLDPMLEPYLDSF